MRHFATAILLTIAAFAAPACSHLTAEQQARLIDTGIQIGTRIVEAKLADNGK